MQKKFKFLEHTADVKFLAFGETLEEAFSNAALAMFNAMYSGRVKSRIKKRISVSGKDNESLLYNFLEELLFLLDSESFFLGKVEKVKINKEKNKIGLEAEVSGDKAASYEIHLDVKAVTYNEMQVKQEKKKFIAQVVVDV